MVMSGTAIAQAMGFALMPLISRLYTPDDFGVFGTFNSVAGVLCVGATLQYSQALMLPKRHGQSASLLWAACFSVLSVSMLCLVAVAAFPVAVVGLLKAQHAGYLLWLLPLAVLVSGSNQCLQAWFVRRKAFGVTATAQVTRTLVASGAQVATGICRDGTGLIYGAIAGDAASSIGMLRLAVTRDRKLLLGALTWKRIWGAAREYSDFPLFSMPQNVLNSASQGLPVILLTHYYGITTAGYYAFGIRILQAPMNLILNALRQVLFQRISEVHNRDGRVHGLFVRSTIGLSLVALLPTLAVMLWGPELFSRVFGSNWLLAGQYARWLLLWSAVGFCNVPSVLLARVLRQQRYLLILDVIVLLVRIGVLVYGGNCLPALRTVQLFSVAGAALNGALIVWVWCLSAAVDRKLLRSGVLADAVGR